MTTHDDALESLLDTAERWAAEDPDPATAAALRRLMARASGAGDDGGGAGSGGGGDDDGGADASDADGVAAEAAAARRELADAFDGTLEFGTAGLRAALGPGSNRMNRVVVRRAAAGLAAFLLEAATKDPSNTYMPRAVVGYDARWNSDVFAAETAAIFTAAGIDTFLLPAALPTPILAYAVRALDAEAGVMVTASHNPPADNGYKVYLGGRAVEESGRGAQIVAPYDSLIAAKIAAVGPLSSIALAESGWHVLDAHFVSGYGTAIGALAAPAAFPARKLKIVLTPMHGVGGETATDVLAAAGFADVTLVTEQAEPDPEFPTVSFPNPEEPGALDLALAAAASLGADLVLANDPDADRAAAAALDPSTGEWRMLRGDEVGALLGAHVAARRAMLATDGGGGPAAGGVFANSIVSSRLLSRIAAAQGYRHEQTLTGFKWISRVPGLVYGYEEALGYCVAPELVRDKDGISAGLLIAEMAAAAKAAGRTLFDTLDDLSLEHGMHASDQLSVRVDNLALLGTMMAALRQSPPSSFGGSAVEVFTDLAAGSEQLPPTDGLLFLTEDGSRVIIRPSGTEPKLKCYLEVIIDVGGRTDLNAARTRARTALDAVLADVRTALGL
ncbi:phospho-sugar mutase [Arthrobacter sp. 35W]|uniref:phospho-sugar mutase n=1 Tax=Arthrobacter sp. 35W TaxID=1132441 RepID=UPI0004155CE2|nr:phospho-sugar mutase [Arthrobacter sp. 35W]